MTGVVRTLAEFHSALPNDTIEDEHAVIQQGGRTVCNALLTLLEKHGFLIDETRDAFDHGWEGRAIANDGSIWIQISVVGEDEFILLAKYSQKRPWFRSPIGRSAAQVLSLLDREMKADDRFSDIRWFALDKNGNQSDTPSPTPVD
jgi:hypothetical protein